MHRLLTELVEPFDRMPEDAAVDLLEAEWGLTPHTLERLDTERDDTFRFDSDGLPYVLKVAHPGDDHALIDLQLAALAHAAAADPGLPLQRVVPSRGGSAWVAVDGRAARVFAWMDGTLARGTEPTHAQLRATGRMLGRLNLALRGFGHAASGRELAWDLQRLPALRELAVDAPAMLEIIDRFEIDVLPALERMPQQVIHNDFHPGNLLVDTSDDGYVTGILDFGDVVHSGRVNDLGVALAYLPMGSSPSEAALPFVDGFESVVPLLPEERALLPHLVSARLVQRRLLNELFEQ
ncbi:Ser/Thr protein kinase RdoA (MazF antagonist) [Leifsonia sp. AK011]|uniref:phosphotransferase n=1 Tax=Leifsonia sp. AK011 TaxID=2723075 RepID=UPI0015C726FB|nr:phosphotransferase [Leifsonia sp. AK011]NYF09565.1 Ser/Thr protein kinase RdoA (MazF antagonist) [Leifsonia sp. AK011]